jgi:hypothetical protein
MQNCNPKEMYKEEKLGALEAMLKMIADKMSGEYGEEEEEVEGEMGSSPMKAMLAEEETVEEAPKALMSKGGDDELSKEKITDFFKNRRFKKPEGVSAKLISVSAKPKSKMKMKGLS